MYGADFADEFHQRLKFNRRGLVAMANKGTPNSNGSQFFITLGEAPELQKKHTIFGKVIITAKACLVVSRSIYRTSKIAK